MPSPSRRARIAAVLLIGLALSGCGKGAQGGNAVAMKDLEVTDGTATDSMTDLDGVRSQGTATVPTDTSNAAVAPKAAGNATVANESDAESLPDQ